jgi:hypothetical protein
MTHNESILNVTGHSVKIKICVTEEKQGDGGSEFIDHPFTGYVSGDYKVYFENCTRMLYSTGGDTCGDDYDKTLERMKRDYPIDSKQPIFYETANPAFFIFTGQADYGSWNTIAIAFYVVGSTLAIVSGVVLVAKCFTNCKRSQYDTLKGEVSMTTHQTVPL